MNPSQLIAVGFAATACAVAVTLHLSRPDGHGDGTLPEEAAARQAGSNPASAAPRATRANRGAAPANRPHSPARPQTGDAATRISHRLTSQSPPHGSPFSSSEWLAKVARVEQDANRELARLAPLLDLSADQERQVFAILARNSTAWLPGMRTAVEPSANNGNPTEIDQLLQYLDADQQDALLREEMDRLAWWEEVLPQLLPPDSPEPETPETKPFDGSEILEE